ncbi:SDR family oxidoreductase [Jatrophihabitans sp. YIM 134969]
MKVVVLGGSGRFGRALVPQLAAQGLHGVAVGRADGVDLRGTTSLAYALDEVLEGADVLVHAATDPRHAQDVDVAGTAKVLEACSRRSLRHVVYLSIVGVDRTPFSYYRAKHAAEQVVRGSGVPATIVRSTQWFPFVGQVAGQLARFGVAPRGWIVAPCDVDEVATLVVRRVMQPPQGATIEMGGPQTVTLARAARDLGGHRVLHLGVPGRLSAAVRDGSLLPADSSALTAARGWDDWVRTER